MNEEAVTDALPVAQLLPPSATSSYFWKRAAISMAVGLVQAICFPPIGWVFLLPICLAGFLVLLNGLSFKAAFRLGFLYGLTWYLGDLFWFANVFGPAAISLCAILAFFTGLFGGSYVWLRERLPRIPAWLIASTAWTGIEYFRSEIFILKFGWLGLGYGVVNSPLCAAGASWLGCYGVTFAVMALAAALARSVPLGRRAVTRGLGLFFVWLIVLLAPLPAPVPVNPLHVRLVQAGSEDEESFQSLSRARSAAMPDVIIWPEYSFASDPRRNPRLWARLQNVARTNHAYFLFGAEDQFDPSNAAGYRNTAFLLDPDGQLVGRHVKNHTVHFFRDGVPGTQASAIPTRLGRLGVAICFDMDYPDVARRLTEDGATVFLVPNDDPAEWGPVQRSQHRLLFQMRAAECGRWLARADVAGGTSAAMPNGRESARIQTAGPGYLDVIVGRTEVRTMFIRGGWRFGPACLIALTCLLAAGVVYSRRAQSALKMAELTDTSSVE